MRFSDIPGHQQAKQQLRTMADSGHIPHALLLEGPGGIGKHALARAFVQYVCCTNRHDGDSCGVCPECRKHTALQHIDTLYSFPVTKRQSKPTISADFMPEFKEFINESPFMDRDLWLEKLGMPNTRPMLYVEEALDIIHKLNIAGHTSTYKTVILWQADRMQEETANKLLKVIEEPPGRAMIIMTSDHPMNVLPTIYSRAQRIRMQRLPDDTVAQWLADNTDADPATASSLAPLAQGSITTAIRMLARKSDTDRYLDMFIKLMRLAYQRDIASLKDWSAKIAAEKRDNIVDFMEYTARMLRENFVANLRRADLNLMSQAEMSFSTNFARFVNERNAPGLFKAVSDAITDIRGNANPKIVLFDFAITVILLLKQ